MELSVGAPRDGKPGLADFVRCVAASTPLRSAQNDAGSSACNVQYRSPTRIDSVNFPTADGIERSHHMQANTSKNLSLLLSLLVFAASTVVLAGWLLHIPILTTWGPSLVAMKFNTAVGFMIAAVSLLLLLRDQMSFPYVLGKILAGIVTTIGLVTLSEFLLGTDWGIDTLFVAAQQIESNNPFPSRMSPISALCLSIIGLSLLLIDTRRQSRVNPSEILAAISLAVSLVGLLGYLYSVHALYRIGIYSSMALHTASASVLMAIAIPLARPTRGLPALVAGTTTGARLARRLLPIAIIVPVLLGWLRVLGERAGFYESPFGTGMFATILVAFLVALIWGTGVVVDSGERKQQLAEETLRRTMEFDEAVVSNIGEGLYTVDDNGLVTSMNPAAEKLFGWTLKELRGKKMHDVTHYKHPDGSPFPADQCPGLKVLREGKTLIDHEDVFIRKDGTFFDVIYSSSPLKSDGNVSGLVVVFRDVTERKHAENVLLMAKLEADDANRAKDQFLAMLSHELRTPLTPVLMTASALEGDRTIATDLRDQLGMIRRNIELEARLIDDLLDVTRIARGKLELREEIVDVHAVIDHALTISNPDLAAKKLNVTKKLDATEHHCRGDGARLQEVFWNILRNAVKFTPESGKIDIVTRNDPDHRVVVEFSDNGIGIEPELQPRIFDAFEQGARTHGSGHGGLGLGLAISKRIVDLHEGTIEARSDGQSQGSTFTIKLKTVPAPPAKEGTRGGGPEPARQALAQVLVVEDHKDTLNVLRRILENSGYAVKACETAADARAAVDQQKFDVLVSDIALPDGSGLDLMRDFRQTQDLSGIALSGFGTQDDLDASKAAGFALHLTKPIDLERLREAISGLLGQKSVVADASESAENSERT